MPSYNIDAALKAGVSPEQIAQTIQEYNLDWPATLPPAMQQYMRSAQTTGLARPFLMAGSEALKGLAADADLPEEAVNLLTRRVVNPGLGTNIGQVPTVSQGLTQAGLINRPNLTPGFGDMPETERLGAAAARGVGGAAPFMALGGPVLPELAGGALGGTASEGAHQAFPDNPVAPLVAGVAAGLPAGAASSLLLRPSTAGVYQRIADDLGAGDATIQSAGRGIQDELFLSQQMQGGRTPSRLPNRVVNNLTSDVPSNVGNNLLKPANSRNLVQLRQEMPDQVDQLAGAMIQRNAPQYNKLAPESQEALFPNPDHRGLIEDTLASVKPPGKTENIANYILGGSIGVLGAHALGQDSAFGVSMGGFAGEAASLLRSKMAARSILDPWFYNATGGTMTGSLAAWPPMQLTMPGHQ